MHQCAADMGIDEVAARIGVDEISQYSMKLRKERGQQEDKAEKHAHSQTAKQEKRREQTERNEKKNWSVQLRKTRRIESHPIKHFLMRSKYAAHG
ncbi:hypothetical protein AKJ16_DCAP07502 [Drosera capensis]